MSEEFVLHQISENINSVTSPELGKKFAVEKRNYYKFKDYNNFGFYNQQNLNQKEESLLKNGSKMSFLKNTRI